jgi:hypothetical protein
MTNRSPIIAAILLLLPVLYVLSYLALVRPQGGRVWIDLRTGRSGDGHYQFFKRYQPYGDVILPCVYWPLEQLDRKLRPDAWGVQWEPARGGAGTVRTGS